MKNIILSSEFFDVPVVRVPDAEVDSSAISGSNQKKLLVVSMREADQETDVGFLTKIFESVKVSLDSDALLIDVTQNKEFSWQSITRLGDFDQVIFFGKDPKKIGLHFEYQWYEILVHQQQRFLFAEPLAAIAVDRTKKGALWAALKKMFL